MTQRSMPRFVRRLLGTAALGALAASLTAAAQDAPPADPAADEEGQVEEVIVTARKTSEKLQKVPASVSVVSAKKIADAGLNEFKDIVGTVPNVAFGGGIASAVQGQIGIRGISTLVRNIGVESGVGFYVDGFWPALWGSLIITIVTALIDNLVDDED